MDFAGLQHRGIDMELDSVSVRYKAVSRTHARTHTQINMI
jgi:hypothetical protein